MKTWQVDASYCLGLEMTEAEAIAFVKQLCLSKAEEFQLFGYQHAKALDVWTCVQSRWKKNQAVSLHGLTSAILSLKVMDWMNWLTISAWKGTLEADPLKEIMQQQQGSEE